MFGSMKKRLDELESSLAAMQRELCELREARACESEERASLSKTLNEWVWGEEKHGRD